MCASLLLFRYLVYAVIYPVLYYVALYLSERVLHCSLIMSPVKTVFLYWSLLSFIFDMSVMFVIYYCALSLCLSCDLSAFDVFLLLWFVRPVTVADVVLVVWNYWGS